MPTPGPLGVKGRHEHRFLTGAAGADPRSRGYGHGAGGAIVVPGLRGMIVRSGRKLPRRADADRALTELYQLHYRTLVRLAALLVPDLATADDIVQDAFAAVYSA